MRNEYEIRGNIVAIFLKRKDGTILETIIDKCNLARAQEFNGTWHSYWNRDTKSFYAIATAVEGRKRTSLRLNRWLTNCPDGLVADHINHDTLNNTMENLRVVTRTINAQNQIKHKPHSSGFRGVSWHKQHRKWSARLFVNNKAIALGCFTDLQQAADAVHQARIKLMPGYVY